MSCRRLMLTLLLALTAASGQAVGAEERVSTAAVVDDGILFVASYEAPPGAGHLRAVSLRDSRRETLWDAADLVPPPGAALPPQRDPGLAALDPPFDGYAGERLIFTALVQPPEFRLLTFEPRAAHQLQPLIGAVSLAETAAIINAVRGRTGASAGNPAGSGDRPVRLGAISRSSPALVGGSPFDAAAAYRDQMLYVGAEDGLLHAILAGRWSVADGAYDPAAPGCGRELWAYLPGSLLPALATATLDGIFPASPGHVDGAPAVADLFFDSDGDGRREWRTLLAGTASTRETGSGVVFVLDVTDPHGPKLLWERPLAEIGLGSSRGAAIDTGGGLAGGRPRLFVTAAAAGRQENAGGLACALDLVDGTLLWQFAAPGAGSPGDSGAPPTAPALMTAAGSGGVDAVLFGDRAGRLWALDPEGGAPLADAPVWQAPDGAAEPIGGGLAVHNRLVLLGTGGIESAASDRRYSVYAVELLAGGARLLWTHPLLPGEKLWGAPTLDRFGRAYFGVGGDGAEPGRLLAVAADGSLAGDVPLAGTPAGGLVLAPGAVITVSRTGTVDLVGELRRAERPAAEDLLRVRVFSWRTR